MVWGFTLMEVLMTVVLMGILASMAVPSYTRVVERGYWRSAQDILQTLYAGEQVYFTVNNAYQAIPPGAWSTIYMDDPNTSTPFVGRVTFTITAAGVGPGATFTATANRGGGRVMTMDQTHQLCTGPPATACGTWPQP